MADTDDSYYQRKIKNWIKKQFWIHRKADLESIKMVIEYENNKAISAMMNAKTDKAELITSAKELPSVKGEKE